MVHKHEISIEAQELARKIKAVIFDVDGVLFPNTVTEGSGAILEIISKSLGISPPLTIKLKTRSYYDGQATSLLRAIGLHLVFVTKEEGPEAAAITDVVTKLNKLPSSKKKDGTGTWQHIGLCTNTGGPKKIIAVEKFLRRGGIKLNESAFMGVDLVDLDLARRVALVAVPVDAEKVIRKMAHFVSERPGGTGAIRDFANFILEARGIDSKTLPLL